MSQSEMEASDEAQGLDAARKAADHTTHFDDCGCKSNRLEAELRKANAAWERTSAALLHEKDMRDAAEQERDTLRLRVAALQGYIALARNHLHSQDEQARTNATVLLDSAGDTTALREMLVEAMHAGARAAIDGSLSPGEAEKMVAGYLGASKGGGE